MIVALVCEGTGHSFNHRSPAAVAQTCAPRNRGSGRHACWPTFCCSMWFKTLGMTLCCCGKKAMIRNILRLTPCCVCVCLPVYLPPCVCVMWKCVCLHVYLRLCVCVMWKCVGVDIVHSLLQDVSVLL